MQTETVIEHHGMIIQNTFFTITNAVLFGAFSCE